MELDHIIAIGLQELGDFGHNPAGFIDFID
jgi:hypothetical protein